MEEHRGRKEAKKNFVELFRDYCSKSTIHGVQYVGDEERPLMEKLYWISIFVVCSCLNFFLIWQVWHKWQVSPVIVSFSEMTTPVWQVPFPAITICLQTNAKRHEFNFENAFRNSEDEEEREKVSAMSLLCEPDIIVDGNDTLSKYFTDFLIDVAPSLEDSLTGCKVGSVNINCREIFRPVFTEDGLCFTSNVLNHSEIFRESWSVEPYPGDFPKSEHWSLEKGYETGSPIETYPRRALTSGDKSGLLVVLSGNSSNHDALCRGPIPGYKLMLHNPAEIPSSSSKYVRIPINQEILVWVQPNIMTTSDDLRSYSSDKRQCFYPDERKLKYFKVYTERNCELECLTNYTLKQCDCVSLYMPRDQATIVCGPAKKECALEATQNIRQDEVKRSYEGHGSEGCNCLPACTSISYQAETSQTNFNWYGTLEAIGEDMSQFDDFTMSRVTIFFTETHFKTSHRSEMFGVVDFLANCGGLLGLFSGISFLSLLEIVYFATLRPCGNLKRENKRKLMKPVYNNEDELSEPIEPSSSRTEFQ